MSSTARVRGPWPVCWQCQPTADRATADDHSEPERVLQFGRASVEVRQVVARLKYQLHRELDLARCRGGGVQPPCVWQARQVLIEHLGHRPVRYGEVRMVQHVEELAPELDVEPVVPADV